MAEHSSIERAARAMCAPAAPPPAPEISSRIEAIIYRELDYYGNNLSGHLAGVLVRELGLRRVDGPLVGTPVHRWVTDWTPDGRP